MKHNFTLTELIVVFIFLIVIAAMGGLVYVAIHFIAKLW